MSFSKYFAALAASVCLGSPSVARADSCDIFSLWARAPRPARAEAPSAHQTAGSESYSPGAAVFESEYSDWRRAHPAQSATPAHLAWLACARRWTSRDTDGDGVPDWRAIVDRGPAALLIPRDEDIDGDGAANILDENPFDASIGALPSKSPLPEHLRMHGERGRLQATLFNDFGLLAVDHTDRHSAQALAEFARFLRHTPAAKLVGPKTSVRILYAFRGHDLKHEIGAFHRELNAVSLAGETATGTNLGPFERARLLGAFAHEIGHAYIFDRMGGNELGRVAKIFGGWNDAAAGAGPKTADVFAPALLAPHPARDAGDLSKRRNMVSQYAANSAHEWFAEAFSAFLLARLAKADRRASLAPLYLAPKPGSYWVNHRNLGSDLATYLTETLHRLH